MVARKIFIIFVCLFVVSSLTAKECVDCHKKTTPRIVSDWQLSKHSQNGINCSECHGDKHNSAQDVSEVRIP
ncbi:cytochrome C, partial [candidate division WOR-3 bacterium]|nr:cytochrome C [candidate division WOR-3 bacterium]